ncbi:hypothetical protein PIB30_100884, partial [Stylosanthes scabra]|nr:hypothetical protein [Stylosanthes scabra]
MDTETSLFSQSTIFATLVLVLFLYALLTSISRRRAGDIEAKKAPPEASGALPLIGHLHLLGGPKPPHLTLGEMADKYGPVFTIRLGVHKTLIISNSEMAKECFTVNDRAFASRPKCMSFEVLGCNFSMIGFSPYGPYWRHVRKLATLEVLSTHRIHMLNHVMESEVKTAIKDSYNLWISIKESGSDESQQ